MGAGAGTLQGRALESETDVERLTSEIVDSTSLRSLNENNMFGLKNHEKSSDVSSEKTNLTKHSTNEKHTFKLQNSETTSTSDKVFIGTNVTIWNVELNEEIHRIAIAHKLASGGYKIWVNNCVVHKVLTKFNLVGKVELSILGNHARFTFDWIDSTGKFEYNLFFAGKRMKTDFELRMDLFRFDVVFAEDGSLVDKEMKKKMKTKKILNRYNVRFDSRSMECFLNWKRIDTVAGFADEGSLYEFDKDDHHFVLKVIPNSHTHKRSFERTMSVHLIVDGKICPEMDCREVEVLNSNSTSAAEISSLINGGVTNGKWNEEQKKLMELRMRKKKQKQEKRQEKLEETKARWDMIKLMSKEELKLFYKCEKLAKQEKLARLKTNKKLEKQLLKEAKEKKKREKQIESEILKLKKYNNQLLIKIRKKTVAGKLSPGTIIYDKYRRAWTTEGIVDETQLLVLPDLLKKSKKVGISQKMKNSKTNDLNEMNESKTTSEGKTQALEADIDDMNHDSFSSGTQINTTDQMIQDEALAWQLYKQQDTQNAKLQSEDDAAMARRLQALEYGVSTIAQGINDPKKSSIGKSILEGKSKIFGKGDKIEARHRGLNRWYPGVITKYRKKKGTYDILYDDGDKEKHVRPDFVRECM